MNHVTLSGTAFEPNTRVAKSGMAVLTFRLSYYQGKGKDGKATYGGIDVTAFDRLAQAWDGQLHDKDKVIVTGHITLDKWERTGKTYNTLKWMTYPSYQKRVQQRSHKIGVLELVDLGEENDHAEK
ncbi:single-stranded DNA-binding protein [Mitsuokella multacida]|uniref:single-stranded DNA-binding protein n=1 Tax=Mitsuokella multacida TaxID=52226 RepID=UPI00242F643D|nr:single-stranded DNA-binding protein [Mitsuokella multacida]